MGFKLDYSEVNDFDGIKDGTYEVFINKAEEGVNPNNKERLHFDLKIRRDVTGQNFGGAHIFDDTYHSISDGKYPRQKLFRVAKAAGLEEGKEYNDFGDFLKDFVGKPMRVTVRNEKSTYQDKEYENLRIKRYEPTKFPSISPDELADVVGIADMGKEINISDDDLPF